MRATEGGGLHKWKECVREDNARAGRCSSSADADRLRAGLNLVVLLVYYYVLYVYCMDIVCVFLCAILLLLFIVLHCYMLRGT